MVNLGLIPSSEIGWKVTCEAITDKGAIIFLHQNISSKPGTSPETCETCVGLLPPSYQALSSSVESVPLCVTYVEGKYHSMPLTKETPLSWKKKEWFFFSLHISHIFVNLFYITRCQNWTITIYGYHRVKSYAPYIDHLVYFLKSCPNN